MKRLRLLSGLLMALLLCGGLTAGVVRAQGDGTEGPEEIALQPAGEPLLPTYRILSYYGFPGNELMGILGEYDREALLEVLRGQAAEYEAADPSRPVKLAFEVIASVAQRDAGADGNYLEYIDFDVIQEYVDFTAANDMLLILDVQFGRNTIQDEVGALREFLAYPHVHLAVDPEFSIEEGETPGVDLGQMGANEIAYALNELATISQQNNIPPKLLIVHQFNYYSLPDKELIEEIPGVQFVLEVDGYGPPEDKRATYGVLTTDVPFTFYGFKLWYRQDEPLMTAAEVVNLVPSPDLVIYQ